MVEERPEDTPVVEERSAQPDASRNHVHHDHSGHEHGHEGLDTAASRPTRPAEMQHHDHSAHDPARFRRLFWWCLALTIPTLVFSTGLQDILGLTGPRFSGSQYIPAVFGTAVFLIGGRIFLAGAWHELRGRAPGMMTLISLAILVAFGYSLAVTLGLPGMDFWWELSTLVTIMLLGHWIEMRAVQGAQDALGELAKLLPDRAEVIRDGHPENVAVTELVVGDSVLVRAGGAIPVDGIVTDGESEVDESLITGESAGVEKTVGVRVVAGSIATTGSLTVRVTGIGSDTAIAGIMRLVADAQASKSPAQLLADRAAGLLFYVALGSALITAVVWWLIDPADPSFVLERVVAVLVIACPHALGLAIPLVAQLTTAIGARRGILLRSRAALEDARSIEVVLFDKTGTLTEGRQVVTDTIVAAGESPETLLALAAAVEARSEHPIGRALVAAAADAGLSAPRATGFQTLAGRGASAVVDGRRLTVASGRTVTERGIRMPADLVHGVRDASSRGAATVVLIEGEPGSERALAAFVIADKIRVQSPQAVALLQSRGIRVALLTGDAHAVAGSVAGRLGITEVFAEVLPGQKAETVARLQAGGTNVAMVGDGINDAPALAQADLGIAIGAGTDVAIESAGVVLASNDPRGVADVITLSTAAYRKMRQNLWWAAGYNVLAIPLAAGVLAGFGILLPPAVAALLMSVSTIVVALNAQLLRRIRFKR